MSLSHRFWSLSSGLILSAFLTAPLAGQGGGAGTSKVPSVRPPLADPESASQELRRIDSQIRVLKGEQANDRQSTQARLRDVIAEKRAKTKPVGSLRERVAKIKKEVTQKKTELQEKKEELEKKRKLSGELKAAMKGYLDGVRELVAAGIPWKVQVRQDSIRAASNIVTDEETGLFPSLAAVGRVQQEEEALGRLVETSTLEVPFAEKKLAVQSFHFGLLAVIYANEDGSVLGFVQAGQEIKDGIAAVEGTPFAEEGYLAAVDILRRRRTPGIVDLYLPVLPSVKGGK